MLRDLMILVAGFAIAALTASFAFAEPASPALEAEIRAVYGDFAAAQNARDPDRIKSFFIAEPEFLWVSDGKSFWGRDDVVRRMTSFQRAEKWRVEPGLEVARVVALGPQAAMLHMPLTLVIGAADAPNRIRFLVSILFVKRPEGWRIASLLTTGAKP